MSEVHRRGGSPSVVYTRYPCAAIVNPGESMKNIIRIVEHRFYRALRASSLWTDCPCSADTGVLLTGDQRGTQHGASARRCSPGNT